VQALHLSASRNSTLSATAMPLNWLDFVLSTLLVGPAAADLVTICLELGVVWFRLDPGEAQVFLQQQTLANGPSIVNGLWLNGGNR
jgi:hypothetical protein